MRWEQFKNRFQQEAQQEQAEVDVNALWNAIEPQVDALNEEESRRRGFLLWFLFGGLLVLGSAWFLNQGSNENPKETKVLIENTIAQKMETPEANSVNNNSKKTPRTSSEEQSSNNDFNQKQKQERRNGNAKPLSKSSTNTDFLNQKKKQDQAHKQAPQISVTQSPIATPQQKTAQQKIKKSKNQKIRKSINPHINQSANQKTRTSKNPQINQSTNPHIRTSTNPQINQSAHPPIRISTNPHINQSTNPHIRTSSNPHIQKSKNQLALLPPLPLSTVTGQLIFPKLKEYSHSPLDDDTQRDKQNTPSLQFSAELLGGLSYINRSLNPKVVRVNPLVNIRETYESPLEAHHYGFAVGLQHSAGFRLSLGIQQTVMAERYLYDATQIAIDSIPGVQVYRINLMGDTIPIMGMLPRTTTTINNKEIFNSYRLLDLPIILSYQYPFGKWCAGVEAGAFLNLSLKTEGIIPDENFRDVDITSKVFKSKIGMSYHLGLSISRSLFKRFELRLAPRLRYFPSDFSVADYELSQKYVLLGGNLGLRYAF